MRARTGRARVRGPWQAGLTWRLGIVVGLVLVAAAVTLWIVAVLVAPQIFHRHLLLALPGGVDPGVQVHVDAAFTNAVLLALGVALPLSLLTGLTVTWVVARRLARSVAAVAEAADTIAHGDLDVRVQEPAMGPELAQLVSAFNSMADRLAATEETRRRLIGDLAHELRTPLAALEATVVAVSDGVLPPDAATLTTLREQTSRLDRLVTDMSAVSRAEERRFAVHRSPVDLHDVATVVGQAQRARFAAAGVSLGLQPDPEGTPLVAADRARLEEVLNNLLDNALQHTPRGGEVQVRVGHDRDAVTMAVVDDGVGFPPGEAERLFERFYRGDAARTVTTAGSGVGLTLARAIVGAHGGTLTAVSAGPGAGATFTVRLPRGDGDRPSPDH